MKNYSIPDRLFWALALNYQILESDIEKVTSILFGETKLGKRRGDDLEGGASNTSASDLLEFLNRQQPKFR